MNTLAHMVLSIVLALTFVFQPPAPTPTPAPPPSKEEAFATVAPPTLY